jgi:hypothetical protein
MSRYEELLNALVNGEPTDIVPRSRLEAYLKNCCDACGCDGLPTPRSRAEVLLYQLAEKLAGGGGSGGGGSAELNIAYGDTPPEDTSKLWVKCSEPNGVIVSTKMNTETQEGSGYRQLGVNFSHKASGMATGVVGDKIYILGGSDSRAIRSTLMYCFDTKAEILNLLETTLLHALHSARTLVVGQKIYIIDGDSHNKLICCYDVDTQTITSLSCQLQSTLNNGASANIGTKVYLFNNPSPYLQIFDGETEEATISNIAFSSSGINHCCAIGDLIYLFRYEYNSSDNNTALYIYDTKNDSISHIKDFGDIGTYNYSVATIGGLIYMFGGTNGSVCYNTIRCFDPSTLELTILPHTLSYQAYDIGVGVVGNDAYLFGGSAFPNLSKAISVYTASGKNVVVEDGKLFIYSNLEKNLFSLVNTDSINVEIGVSNVYKGNADGIGEQVETALYKDGTWTNI